MIKKILLTLGFVGLSLISFTNAECTINTLNLDGVYKNGYMHSSIGSNAFDIGITSKGTVISQSFGIGKNVFAFDDYHMFRWDIYGNPYLYYSGTTQGYFQYYGVCDELTADSTGAVNCSKIAYDSENSKPLIQNFLSTTTVNDYYGYRYYKDGNNYHYYVHVCFSSHEIGKSLCFKYYRCTYNVDCRANNCNLTGSLGYSKLTFASIPDSIIGKSPGLTGGDSGDSFDSSTGQYVELTGNLVYSDEKCTVGEIIDYAQGAGYNRYLCFGGLDNFDDFDSTLIYSPIPGTGKALGQILANAMGTWDTPNNWFEFWNGLYQDRNNYISMRESYPAVYRTWFDLYYQYGGADLIFDSVNEYCTMISLVSDYTQLYNGTYFKNTCENYIIPNRNNNSDNAVGIDWGGIFGNTGNIQIQNGKSFISNFFTQVKTNFRVPNSSDFGLGILPKYIIWALLGIIFFRFLRK